MTVVVTVAFFVLFAASKAQGGVRVFGRILGIWILLIALMFPVGSAFMVMSGKCPMMGGKWNCPMRGMMKDMMMKKDMPQMPPFAPPAQ